LFEYRIRMNTERSLSADNLHGRQTNTLSVPLAGRMT
jgi:hypothetical protein